ncbi:MAG: DUF1700 domain-containing protein [Peptostreptococcus porci]|uniref:DUF1700 domain-containing protein n=1 Tax=Peptostreptococcus porci TaxID=2652282 RepID=UPI002A74B022|nr:DUF1700 domain-containing protein [Peptostreptococcus porci]MDY2794369.1 DUF1700 domain-containing protein [Peptostreptococcus porci]MDY5479149.1 DUF1700 domain-containing protein [Peptostreptococcus porci]
MVNSMERIMNKKEFLSELRLNLRQTYSNIDEKEIEDIVRDYEEYFTDGIIEGKSELELVDSLGDPKKIVEEMDIYDRDDVRDRNDMYTINDINDGIITDKKFQVDLIFHGFIRFFEKVALALFDLIYFPVVVFGVLSIIGIGLFTLLFMPYLFATYEIIGAVKFFALFPMLTIVSALVLVIIAGFYLVKLGVFINKKVYGYISRSTKIK